MCTRSLAALFVDVVGGQCLPGALDSKEWRPGWMTTAQKIGRRTHARLSRLQLAEPATLGRLIAMVILAKAWSNTPTMASSPWSSCCRTVLVQRGQMMITDHCRQQPVSSATCGTDRASSWTISKGRTIVSSVDALLEAGARPGITVAASGRLGAVQERRRPPDMTLP